MVVLVLTVFILFFALIRHLLYLFRMESYVKHVKSSHPLLPIVGTTYGMAGKSASEVYKDFLQFVKVHDSPVKAYLGSTLIVMLDRPADVKIILSSPRCLDKPFVFDFFPYRTGIFTTRSSHVWKPIRRHLNPTFNLKVLQSFTSKFNEKAKVMIEKLDAEVDKGEFDIYPYIQWSTLDTICGTALGFELKTQSHHTTDFFNSIYALSCIFSQRFMQPWIHSELIYKLTSMYKSGQNHLANLRLLTNSILEKKKEEILAKSNNRITNGLETTEIKPQILIEKLVKLQAAGEFDDDVVKEQIETILVAGNETSTTTISFAILMLAMHPEIQERVFHEIYTVFTAQDEDILDAHLNLMPYLDSVIKETLRLFPAAPNILRSATADITIDSCTIPKGAIILVSLYSLQRRQGEWGEDADKFNPDHFLPENMSKRHPFAFIPFAAGQRNCIGNRYAIISMKISLIMMLRRYKFTTSLKMCDIDLRFEVIIKLATQHLVQIERRSW